MADINGALAQCLSAFAFAYHVPLGVAPPPPPHITGQPPGIYAPPPPQVPLPAPNAGQSRDEQRAAVRQAAVEFCTRFPDDWACNSGQGMPIDPPPRRR
jgi:hypothetical protein